MNITINQLPTASTIDGSLDLLPIYTASSTATQSINRNTFLNLSSQPLGLTDTQSPTNKTLGNTNTVTLKDTLFTLQDDGDTSKQLKFQLSGITTSTTRTLTIPDVSDTLVTLGATQTLTNKTLTSPTINSPTISNATLSADTITGFTTAGSGTIYGLGIASGGFTGAISVGGLLTASNAFTLSSGTLTLPSVSINQVALPLGTCVQEVSTVTGAVSTGTTTTPQDDTIPQSNEGVQYMSQSITPKATTNILVIEVIAYVSFAVSATTQIMALFQDSTANAIAVASTRQVAATSLTAVPMRYTMAAGTTSSTTFKVRIGASDAGTNTFNGTSGARAFGGVSASSIVIREYKA